MVKTELSYNPYLRETIVKFNEQEPRINSQIEKYQYSKLQDWIEKLPSIFHDEMNGYGFELLFTGVEEDFYRIQEAFKKAGVTESEVSFIYKNSLDNPVIKNKQINELYEWIKQNPNRIFDYEGFREKYKEILDTPYSFITIHGEGASTITLSDETINIENIDDVDELTTTDLTNIPVVMFVESNDNIENRKNLQKVICREDINNKQLFFCIKSGRNKAQIERIIYDLGIKHPVLVSGVDDDRIKEYFEVYPLTEYIKTFLDVFRTEVNEMQKSLDAENLKYQMLNNEIYGKLHRFENDIRLLKEADEKYLQRDNFVVPEEYKKAYDNFLNKIAEWRRKKTKTTLADEAARLAYEFSTELEKYYGEFVDEVDQASVKKSEEIDEMFSRWFADTKVEPNCKIEMDLSYEAKSYITPRLYDSFMTLKSSKYIEQKGSILDMFKMSDVTEERKPVLEITYSFEEWRSHATREYEPLCQQVIDDWTNTLSKYYSLLAEKYHQHIASLIIRITNDKNVTAGQLSEDEKLRQVDNDWLTELKDKMHSIERG